MCVRACVSAIQVLRRILHTVLVANRFPCSMSNVLLQACAVLAALVAATAGLATYSGLAWHWTLLLCIVVAAAAVGIVIYRGLQRVAPKPQAGIPCPPLSHPVLGHPDRMLSSIKHELRLEVCESTDAPFHQLLVMKHVSVFINDAVEAAGALKKFTTKGDIYRVFRLNPDVPDIISSDGDDFNLRKRALGSCLEALHTDKVYVDDLMSTLDALVESGATLNAAEVFTLLAFDVVSHALFDYRLGAVRGSKQGAALYSSISVLLEQQAKSGIYADPNARVIPEHELKAAQVCWKTFIDDMTTKIISEAEAQIESGKSLDERKLGHCLKKLAQGKGGYGGPQTTADVHQLFRHGYETIAGTLCWMYYALAFHPKVQKRLHQEVSANTGTDCPEFLECVLKESLRRYAVSGNTTVRTVSTDDAVLGEGVPIAKGTPVHVHMWSLHNTAREWEKPRVFLPDRWLSGALTSDGKPAHPKCPFFSAVDDIYSGVGHTPDSLSFFPFSAGDRVCMGKDFALDIFRGVLMCVSNKYRLNFANSSAGEDFGQSQHSVVVPRNADSTTFRVSLHAQAEIVPPKVDDGWAADSDAEDEN